MLMSALIYLIRWGGQGRGAWIWIFFSFVLGGPFFEKQGFPGQTKAFPFSLPCWHPFFPRCQPSSGFLALLDGFSCFACLWHWDSCGTQIFWLSCWHWDSCWTQFFNGELRLMLNTTEPSSCLYPCLVDAFSRFDCFCVFFSPPAAWDILN